MIDNQYRDYRPEVPKPLGEKIIIGFCILFVAILLGAAVSTTEQQKHCRQGDDYACWQLEHTYENTH